MRSNNRGLPLMRMFALVFCAALVFGLAGCAGDALLFRELPAADVQEWVTGEELVQRQDMLGVKNMKKAAESEGVTLYINEKTTEIAVIDTEGTVWFSNPQNRLGYNTSLIGKYSSTLLVTAVDGADSSKSMNSFDDSVRYGQFSISPITGGIQVNYNFGRVVERPVYPQVMTADRFNEMIEKLTDKQRTNMERYYLEVNYETVTDQQVKSTLKETYTLIEQQTHLFVLKQSPSAIEKGRITEYLTELGYTQEDRDRDHASAGYTDPDKAHGNFIVPVRYTLDGGKLRAHIPVEEITVTDNLKIESMTILPYMNTEAGLEDSKGIFPDGSGAVMELSAVRSSFTPEYEESFFGRDYALYQSTETSQKRSLNFPVYGIVAADGAMMAVMEEGAATASLTATARVSKNDAGSIGFKSRLLDYAKVKLTDSSNETVNSYPEKSIADPIAAVYSFIPGKGRAWTDIAAAYRDYLYKGGQLTRLDNSDVPVIARLLGAVDDTQPFLGIPREVTIPLTTFKQAEELAKEMQETFKGTQLAVRYTGWTNGGIKSSRTVKLDAESKLGGNKGFNALTSALSDMRIKFFPDADFQYVYRDGAFDGFTTSRDAVRFITRESAYKPYYNMANYLPDNRYLFGYLLDPAKWNGDAKTFVASTEGTGLSGLSLPYIASDLYSNYKSGSVLSRNAAAGYAQEVLQTVKGAQMDVMSEGAAVYALSELDYALEIPGESNSQLIFSESVPFTQMVLSGSVRYAAEELNFAADDRYYLLKCIETGSALSFTAMAENSSVLKDTAYSAYYVAGWKDIGGRAAEISAELQKALAPVYGKQIIGHSRISDDVVRVDYENGRALLVNYSMTDAVTEAGTVPAAGWLAVEGGDGA